MILPADHVERGVLKKVWAEFNKLRAFCQASQPIGGNNIRVDRTARGSVIRSIAGAGEPGESGSATVGLFIVDTIGADTLTCRYAGPSNAEFPLSYGETATVLKPRWLRITSSLASPPDFLYQYVADSSVTNHNGRTARWVNGTHTLEWDELIMPPYMASGTGPFRYIWAAHVGENHTDVAGCDWIDLNTDARTWWIKPSMYAVCVDGNARYIAAAGGEAVS